VVPEEGIVNRLTEKLNRSSRTDTGIDAAWAIVAIVNQLDTVNAYT
jgi:hypothetical protein